VRCRVISVVLFMVSLLCFDGLLPGRDSHVFGLSSEIETYVCYAFKIQSTRGLDERCAYE